MVPHPALLANGAASLPRRAFCSTRHYIDFRSTSTSRINDTIPSVITSTMPIYTHTVANTALANERLKREARSGR